MSFAEENRTYLLRAYVDENKSSYEIAEALHTYPNKVTRALRKLGVKIKDKSEAQSGAIASGRHSHPTKGKRRSDETKVKISEKVHENWHNMSADEASARNVKAAERWAEKSDSEKSELLSKAGEGLRRASKDGSKLEIYLREALLKAGYHVIFHKKGLIVNDKLEVDLFIPELNTAIEIDGPSHFLPIWGPANLQKHLSADARKAGLLIAAGYCIIRLKNLVKTLSEKHKRDSLSILISKLEEIKVSFPGKTERYIELEVN